LEGDVDIVRDLLDKQVLDRNGRELGRVDSVILERRQDGSARVSAIEIGLVTFGQRLSPFLGRCARAIETILGVDSGRPVRIPFAKIISLEKDVKVDLAATDTPVTAIEQRARTIVSSIPGAS
jgi:sporulation protein YlmC with PRC-barrel domain